MIGLQVLKKIMSKPSLIGQIGLNFRRNAYIFERVNKPFAAPVPEIDFDREIDLDRDSYVYRLIEHEEEKPWGNIDVILTEYLEVTHTKIPSMNTLGDSGIGWKVRQNSWFGIAVDETHFIGVGHKGEIVSISREMFYYYLWPSELADFPTDENLKRFEEDRKLLVSAYALKMKKMLENMTLNVFVPKDTDWVVNEEAVQSALRRDDIMCKMEAIEFLDQKVTSKSASMEFSVKVNINDLTWAKLRCVAKPFEEQDLWDDFNIKKKIRPL